MGQYFIKIFWPPYDNLTHPSCQSHNIMTPGLKFRWVRFACDTGTKLHKCTRVPPGREWGGRTWPRMVVSWCHTTRSCCVESCRVSTPGPKRTHSLWSGHARAFLWSVQPINTRLHTLRTLMNIHDAISKHYRISDILHGKFVYERSITELVLQLRWIWHI